MADTALKFDEIKALIQSLEHPSCSVKDDLPKMDKIERIKYWLNFAADRQVYEVKRPRLSLYAASHGFAKDDQAQKAYYKDMVAALLSGEHAINEVINLANADLRLYDLNMDEPTADLREGAAMDDDALLNSMAYGMMTIEPENDLISASAIGAGSEALGRVICANYIDGIESKLEVHFEELSLDNCFSILKEKSGYEINALFGAIIAARLAHIPMILEGYAAIAAGLILQQLNKDVVWHCAIALPSDVSAQSDMRAYLEAHDWLVLDDPRPYKYEQASALNGGMHIAALRQMLILDHYYGAKAA